MACQTQENLYASAMLVRCETNKVGIKGCLLYDSLSVVLRAYIRRNGIQGKVYVTSAVNRLYCDGSIKHVQ